MGELFFGLNAIIVLLLVLYAIWLFFFPLIVISRLNSIIKILSGEEDGEGVDTNKFELEGVVHRLNVIIKLLQVKRGQAKESK
jgi:hypothetical protein